MHSPSSLSESQSERLVELFDQRMGSKGAACVLRVPEEPAMRLQHQFRLHCTLCLAQQRTYRQYRFATKKEVVERFLPVRQDRTGS